MVPEIALLTKDFGVKADQNQCGLVSMTYLFPRSLQRTVKLQKPTVSSFLRQFVEPSADQGFFLYCQPNTKEEIIILTRSPVKYGAPFKTGWVQGG
jgi:hypothetical protein